MGKIEVIGKWNLKENNWQEESLDIAKGRSFAFANYETIVNGDDDKIDYIIFAHGSRVEDHSRDFVNIKESKAGVNNIINYFKSSKKNIVIKLFLMDADAPIKEDAKLLAKYIDSLSLLPNTNSVNLMGLSKCGAMSFYVPKYFETLESFRKTNIYTVAAPFEGTKLASPKIFYPEVRALVKSKLGDNKLSALVAKEIISIYEGVSSNSHMDYDIAMQGGIPETKLHLYDETLIKDIFSSDNIDAILKVNSYKNLVTGIDDKTLSEALRTMNFAGIGLCLLDDWFFDKKSDGMVMTSSQRLVESKMPIKDFRSHILTSAHHDVSGNPRIASDISHIIEDTIDEQNDREKYRTRRKI